MSDTPSFPTRRGFIKKSLAGAFIASQPAVLTGLLRATGVGGGSDNCKLYVETMDFYLTFEETYDYGMDYAYDGLEDGYYFYY